MQICNLFNYSIQGFPTKSNNKALYIPLERLTTFKELVKLIIVQYKSFQHICITIRRLSLKNSEFENMQISLGFSYIAESGIQFSETL